MLFMETEIKEKMRVALILALNAGFMDGFSFFHFEGRFIGAQTGNLVQGGIKLAQGDFKGFWDFTIPIIFFLFGVLTRVLYSNYLVKRHKFDATYLLLLEWLGVTGFAIAYGMGLKLSVSLYVGIFSYFMAIQFDTFKKVHGMVYVSLFMTGNMRSLAASFSEFLITHDKQELKRFWVYFLLITFFFIGTIFSTLAINWLGSWTLLISTVLLGCVYLIMRLSLK